MEKITRTIEQTVINVAEVVINDGKVDTIGLNPITVGGKVKEDKILKLVRKTYGKEKNYAIIAVDNVSKTYEMDLSKFIELATVKSEVE